jgi:hypothetical protein
MTVRIVVEVGVGRVFADRNVTEGCHAPRGLGKDRDVPADELLPVPLTDDERKVLLHGITAWGGPARATETFARAMGFESVADLHAERPRLLHAIQGDEPLGRADWRRVLLLTEIAFASDVVGSGVEWQTTSGLSDEATVHALRRVQRKLTGVR